MLNVIFLYIPIIIINLVYNIIYQIFKYFLIAQPSGGASSSSIGRMISLGDDGYNIYLICTMQTSILTQGPGNAKSTSTKYPLYKIPYPFSLNPSTAATELFINLYSVNITTDTPLTSIGNFAVADNYAYFYSGEPSFKVFFLLNF